MYRYIESILEKKELLKLSLISLILTMIAGMEVAGIGLIAFILINFSDLDSAIISIKLFSFLTSFSIGSISSPSSIFIFLILCYSLFTVSVSILFIRYISLYSQLLGAKIKERVAVKFLSMDLEETNQLSSSESMSRIIFDSEQVGDSIYFLMHLFSKFVLAILIVAFLLLFNSMLTLIFVGMLIFIYILLFSFFNSLTKTNSTICTESKDSLTKVVKNMFGSLKEILFYDKQDVVVKNISLHNNRYAYAKGRNIAYAQMPRSIVDSLILFMLMVALVLLKLQDLNPEMFFSTISVFGVAALRLLPAFQNIFYYAHEINSRISSLINLYRLDVGAKKNISKYSQALNAAPDFRSFTLKNINYKYPSASSLALKDISFKFDRGQKIALFGSSGSGKSTFLDILLGLITPTSGEYFIDGSEVSFEELNQFKKLFSYLPQKIFFLEASVRENILFGANDINLEKSDLGQIINMPSLNNLIKQLPNKLDTIISDDQQHISGGQKQLIGMARAFARGGKVLILDESTSAMDSKLETEVFETVLDSSFDTLICITHKSSLLKKFDIVHFFHEGEIISSGSFEEIYQNNGLFKQILDSDA